ncbi:MAG: hypothetical protein M3Q79_00375 [bacterium]|nr:hypothetical protein [bacterium]
MDFINKNRELVILGVILVALLGFAVLNSNSNGSPDSASQNSSQPDELADSLAQEVGVSVDEAANSTIKSDSDPVESSNNSEAEAPVVAEQQPTSPAEEPTVSTEPPESTENPAPNEVNTQPQSNSNESYTYTAQTADSYSKLARKAVQTYGLTDNVQLSQAQIIAAETWLASGKELLNQGQSVTMSKLDVKAAIERAKALTADQQALWQSYVAGVNFDTNSFGE